MSETVVSLKGVCTEVAQHVAAEHAPSRDLFLFLMAECAIECLQQRVLAPSLVNDTEA